MTSSPSILLVTPPVGSPPPRVTVIIPTWNWSAVLPFSIGSVLRQTWTDFELLVIGDGCTDDSEAVVLRLAQTDSRVRWINLPQNFGQQAAPNNEGLRVARGELISYLGHDDLWFPGHLAAQVAAIDAGADLVLAGVASITPESVVRPACPPFVPGNWFPPTGVMHRKSMTGRVGGWGDWRKLKVDPETDLWSRMLDAGARHAVLPGVSAIKFAAAVRKDVYKRKSSREQSTWTERIVAEPGLAAELCDLAGGYSAAPEKKRTLLSQVWVLLPWRVRLGIRRHVFRQTGLIAREPGESYPSYFQRRLHHKGAGESGKCGNRKSES